MSLAESQMSADCPELQALSPDLEVATLVGNRQLESTLRCLRSLVRTTRHAIEFRIHCDGTLTPENRERLRSELPVRRFVLRDEADAVAARTLARFPHLRRLREQHILILKLVDVLLFEQGPRLTYVDSDVLFLRPFRFAAEHTDGDLAVFFPDLQSAYSLRSTQLLLSAAPRLPARVNTGLFSIPVDRIDFAVADRFLGTWHGRSKPWIEQTCWALCAGVEGTSLFDSRQMTIPSGPLRRDLGWVALHFVSSVRGRLSELPEDPVRSEESEPVTLTSHPARRLTAGSLLLDELRRRMRSRRTA